MLKTSQIQDCHRFPQSIRACMTADTIGVSTGPQIRNRTPVVNSTSITPGDVVEAVVGTATLDDATLGAPYSCRRQRNSWLACIPASRATAAAVAPGSIAAATMRSFSALDHFRRCRTEVTMSACVFVIGSPDPSRNGILAHFREQFAVRYASGLSPNPRGLSEAFRAVFLRSWPAPGQHGLLLELWRAR